MSGGSSSSSEEKDSKRIESLKKEEQQWQELPSVDKWDNRARGLGAEPIEAPLTKLSEDVAKELRDSRGSKPGPYTTQKNIFGTHRDRQWEKEGDQWVDRGEEDLPLQGAANWSDVWSTYEQIGTDFMYEPQGKQPVEPLLEIQKNSIPKDGNSIINRWVRLLGKGGFGDVWQVKYSTKRGGFMSPPLDGACKVLRLDGKRIRSRGLVWCVEQLLKDLRPLQYLSKLEDELPPTERMKGRDHIMRIIDDICIPDSKTNFPFSTVLILMELCHGTLKDLCYLFGHPEAPESRLPPEQNLQWMRQITSAVQYLHQHNVVHLDIKPINIMYKMRDNRPALTRGHFLKESNQIVYKLGDFGSCQSYAPGVAAETNIPTGSSKYAPPEVQPLRQNWGKAPKIATKPWDVYCLGTTLSQCALSDCVYSKHYMARDLALHMGHIANGKQQNPNVPQQMADLISKMIATNPNSRPTIEAVVAHPWLAPVSQSSSQGSLQTSNPELPRSLSSGSPPRLGPSTSQKLSSRSPESSSQTKRKRSESSDSPTKRQRK